MRIILAIIIAFFGCSEPKEIQYAGFDDLVFGTQQIILYEDRTFYFELSAGGTKGIYAIANDTIKLLYDQKPSGNWPEIFIMDEKHFESIPMVSNEKGYRITRYR